MSCCYKIYRASHRLYGKGPITGAISSFFRHLNQFLFACHIGSGAKIGERCIFQHNGVGVVVSDYAVIGDDCMIFQNVTIGVREDGQVEAPTIGNSVVVGAGSILLGGIKIGDGAKIGAGAVVLTDVGAGETVVGVPAKPIDGKRANA